MSTSLFDTPAFAGLLGDPPLARLLSDSAELRAMMLVEGALATAQAQLGVIPSEAADAINRAAREAEIDPGSLKETTAKDGLIVPGFVAAFRNQIGDPELAAFLHHGATSQDILDTGLALRLRQILALLDERLAQVLAGAAHQALAHKGTVMATRTRGQVAMPSTFGAKIAQWSAPFFDHKTELDTLRPRLLVAHLHGAAGTSAALTPSSEVRAAFATELGLQASAIATHSNRAALVALGHWLARVASTCGKIGKDLLLLAQSELREVTVGEGGASSTMPHKTNPVLAEMLVTLGQYARTQAAGLAQAQDNAHERDGAAWTLEWMLLPGLIRATGASLNLTQKAFETMTADPKAMGHTLEALKGLTQAESAVFALAEHMPRPEAQTRVKAACKEAAASQTHLAQVLAEQSPVVLDWEEILAPQNAIGDAKAQVEAFCAQVEALKGS